MTDPQPEGAAPAEAPAPPAKPRGHRRPVIKRRVKRKEREEELQTPDEFQERGRPVVDWVLARWRIIAGAVGAILIALAIVGLLGRAESNRNVAAAGALAEAMLKLPENASYAADLSDEKEAVDATLAELDKVIAEHSDSPQAAQAALEAGNISYRAGDFEKALGYYDQAKDAKGLTGSLAATGAGYALEALERYADAAARFEAVYKRAKNKRKEAAAVDLGRAWEAAGETAKAAALYAEFETEFPDSSRLADVQSRAANLKGAGAE